MKKDHKAEEIEENEKETVENSEQENSENNNGTDQPVSEDEEDTSEEQNTDELSEMKEKYLRMYSEFENFRRRTAKERSHLIGTANADLLKDLLPVLDDFERALDSAKEEKGALKEGTELIYHKFKKTLEKSGVKVMDLKQGSEFDTDLHEAISQFPTEDKKLKGKIIDVVEKGYFLKDTVLRFAKVVVGS